VYLPGDDVLQSDGVPAVAEERRAAFDFRRTHSAGGQFITEDVLAAAGDLPVADVLRTHLLGFANQHTITQGQGAPVALDVYVNGLRVADVLDGLHARDLMGVEYYEASAAPVSYRRAFSSAPVLLLWLKP
jgi:hypothetical protein